MRAAAMLGALLNLGVAASAAAAPLSVVKASSIVSDGVDTINPKALPGARVDYTVTLTNPVANIIATVAAVTVTDPIATSVKFCLADLGAAGSGPVEFTDGNLLGLGLLGSGLGYAYVSLASSADGLDFSSDGTTWGYVPVADTDGCDPQVRAIRVRLTGNFTAASGFRLRFSVRVR